MMMFAKIIKKISKRKRKITKYTKEHTENIAARVLRPKGTEKFSSGNATGKSV